MADNLGISVGSDANVATDDISGVHYQKVKQAFGADGSVTLVETVAPLPTKPGAPVTGDYTTAVVSTSSSGETALVALTSSQSIRVMAMVLVFAGACTVKFKDGASGSDLTGAMTMKPGGSIVLDPTGEPWLKASNGNAFVMELSVGVQVSGWLKYTKSA
ncbi:hypothetical protein UFOVP998_13 [uncultured Caudovirales phage]|uniref:Uncharacterized protein n=1 Tax=uncultured Caudovirales phage TaxID=2100421 RepID=A0A6J5QCG0_9CAUD|nr:hypothetical protein UFOVP998_13 [uncultured Caudovirales phage]CAB4199429.1 hypothetical protein UFOVP1331_46 [uncultured Caudovirales phage]CAB4212842.1 hypothetical protein UFOVP1442_29 [uncultured Caudovirales phage]CAB5228010.1 hypothetical protein UFOVP1535_22 [uncultured Caudovirales phage]